MAAAGWTSPTGVWLPVAGVENGATKSLSFPSSSKKHQAAVGSGCYKQGLGRCGSEYLWVYGRRGGVNIPARRCWVVVSGTIVGPARL